MAKKFKRRNYFIKKDLQGKYIFSYFILVILGTILFTLFFSYMTYNTLSIIYDDYNLKVGNTPFILFNRILGTHWLLLVFGGIAIIVISMFLTHRFAGPIYRFEKSFDEMINGNIADNIVLRRKDDGKELAKKINEFNSLLSTKLMEISNLVNSIDTHLVKLADITKKTEVIKESDIELEKARSTNNRIREILADFKLKSK